MDDNQQAPHQTANSDSDEIGKLIRQNQQMVDELKKLNSHKLVMVYNSIPRLVWFHLMKGIAFGLGSVLGATVVLSALVFILSQIEFIPVIGDWVSEIIAVVKSGQ